MKCLGLIALLCAALAFAACGDDSSGSPDSSGESLGPVAERGKPVVEPPGGPPPTKLIVKDLEEGSGPGAKKGDELSIHYVGVDTEGTELYSNWTTSPLTFELGASGFFEGWDESMEGMKVGGRRELTFPAVMAGEPRFYVVDLLRIK